MNFDELYSILLNTDINNIKYLYKINKYTVKILHDKHFWINKFHHDNLPYLLQFPNDIVEIISEYNNIDMAKETALKLVDTLSNFKNISIDIQVSDWGKIDWLPSKIVNQIHSVEKEYLDMNSFLYFNIAGSPFSTGDKSPSLTGADSPFSNNQYSISFELSRTRIKWDESNSESDELEITTVTMNKKEFILYLIKLFYYLPDAEFDTNNIYIDYDNIKSMSPEELIHYIS